MWVSPAGEARRHRHTSEGAAASITVKLTRLFEPREAAQVPNRGIDPRSTNRPAHAPTPPNAFQHPRAGKPYLKLFSLNVAPVGANVLGITCGAGALRSVYLLAVRLMPLSS